MGSPANVTPMTLPALSFFARNNGYQWSGWMPVRRRSRMDPDLADAWGISRLLTLMAIPLQTQLQ
ncbi:hypothetical protein D3C83_81610 [compost metagenome]